MPSDTYNTRRYLFEDWSEEDQREQLSTVDLARSGTAADVTGQTEILNVSAASGEQLRVHGWSWFGQATGSPRMRIHAIASVGGSDGYASVIQRSHLNGPGERAYEGEGWRNPYTTVNFHSDGSLMFRSEVAGSSANASAEHISVSVRASKLQRLDPGTL